MAPKPVDLGTGSYRCVHPIRFIVAVHAITAGSQGPKQPLAAAAPVSRLTKLKTQSQISGGLGSCDCVRQP